MNRIDIYAAEILQGTNSLLDMHVFTLHVCYSTFIWVIVDMDDHVTSAVLEFITARAKKEKTK